VAAIKKSELVKAKDLETACAEIASSLGLTVRHQVKVGRRVYGPIRHIDVVVTDPTTRKSLGIECKLQVSKGTAEEKIPSTFEDIAAWPIPGIVCFTGSGFSAHIVAYMYASGKAVEIDDLEDWLRLYFVL
jgi:hypothetical protein